MPSKGGKLGAARTTVLAEETASFTGLQSAGELLSPLDLAKALLNLAPSCTGVSLPGELAGVLNSSPMPTPAWSSDSAGLWQGPKELTVLLHSAGLQTLQSLLPAELLGLLQRFLPLMASDLIAKIGCDSSNCPLEYVTGHPQRDGDAQTRLWV